MSLAKFVWVALMPNQQVCCNIVALNGLRSRIPVHMMVSFHSDPVKKAGRAGAMADLRWSRWLFAGVNTVQPVAVLVVGRIQVISVGPMTESRSLESLARRGTM